MSRVLDSEVARESKRLGVELSSASGWERFRDLLEVLGARGLRPVVLIDEYDKPILQCLEGMRRRNSCF